jgi:hypothetical protein
MIIVSIVLRICRRQLKISETRLAWESRPNVGDQAHRGRHKQLSSLLNRPLREIVHLPALCPPKVGQRGIADCFSSAPALEGCAVGILDQSEVTLCQSVTIRTRPLSARF